MNGVHGNWRFTWLAFTIDVPSDFGILAYMNIKLLAFTIDLTKDYGLLSYLVNVVYGTKADTLVSDNDYRP
jgi:hypothetical protein